LEIRDKANEGETGEGEESRVRGRKNWGSEGRGRHNEGPQVGRRRLGAGEKRHKWRGGVKDLDGGGSEDSTTLRPEKRGDADERVRQVGFRKKITWDGWGIVRKGELAGELVRAAH
jgi:hypothetical protein